MTPLRRWVLPFFAISFVPVTVAEQTCITSEECGPEEWCDGSKGYCQSAQNANDTYVTVPSCDGPEDCSSNSCVFLDFFTPVRSCPVPGRCACAPDLTAVSCESPQGCRLPSEACFSLETLEPVDVCTKPDGCVCAPAPEVSGQSCFSSEGCAVEGDSCVHVASGEHTTACPDNRCVCADPMINFPCVIPEWKERGCETFEMIDSVCNGGLLSNVAEVCGDNKCKVLVPGFAAGGSCKGYCQKQGLSCKSAWNVEEPSCDWNPEETSCEDLFDPSQHKVCECGGFSTMRNRALLPNSMVDACFHLLNGYESCVQQRPELWEYLPKPSIRENIERERRAKCVAVPKDKVNKLGIVTCQHQ